MINASIPNPFDRSCNSLQRDLDAVVFHLLAKMSNFSVNVVRTPLVSNLSAYRLDPDAWTVEQLVNGTCELSSTTMILHSEAVEYPVEYSVAIGTFRPQLFYKAKSVREEHNIYYIPFSSEVWVCLVGLLVVITLALTFILGMETKLPHDTPYDLVARMADEQREWNDGSKLRERERWEIGEILLIAIGVLGQQGSARDPSTSAARMLLLVMFVLAVLAYTAYSASIISLVSLLPTADRELSQVPGDALPRGRKVLVQDKDLLRHSSELAARGVVSEDLSRGLDHAVAGNALFIGDRDISLTYVHGGGYSAEERCSLARAFLGIEYQRVFAFRKGSKLKEPIDANIIRLREFGVLDRERRKLFNLRYPCSAEERSSASGFISFNFSDIKPALCLLGSGLMASTFLLCLESLAFSGSKAIAKLCLSSWTRKDERVQRLLSKLRESKTATAKVANVATDSPEHANAFEFAL